MVEGMAALNRHVVDAGCWERGETLSRPDGSSRPAEADSPQVDILEDRTLRRRPQRIRKAVEAEIIPRLLLSHGPAAEAATAPKVELPAAALASATILHFVDLLLGSDDDLVVSAHVAALEASGCSIETIYLDLFEPAARHIGDLWCADLCSFVDVTLAVGTMQKLLRTFGPTFHKAARPADGRRHALLVPLPGEQHTFGLSMVAEFFRRAGWNVWSTPFGSHLELAEAVRQSWFTVVGFSASIDSRLDELAEAIRLVRRESCNGALGVLVGGPLFVDRPDYVLRVGADAWGADARQALDQAEGVLALGTGS